MIEINFNLLGQRSFYLDRVLLLSWTSLLLIGYVMVVSSSLHLGEKMTGNIFYYPLHQLVHILIGLVIAMGIAFIPMSVWEKNGSWLFIAGMALLVIVLLPSIGIRVNGSTRWLAVAGFRIQVSEIVKFISVIYMSGYMLRHQVDVCQSTYGLVKPLILFSIACALLLQEPDFGSAVVILTIAMGMMYLGGARLQQFLILTVLVVTLAGLLVWRSHYRWARVTAFMNPWADAHDHGFQLVQALISFGRGHIFGVGLGNGIQKLFYLPEAHTDFLFSVLAEELGLMGVILVVGLFTILVWKAFQIGGLAEHNGLVFNAFTAYGLGIWFGFQSFINMGVNMGILPTKGLTLPFMSYGGGSMIIMCSAMAVLFRINHEVCQQLKAEPDRTSQWASV